jgi:hypothetical protein
VTRTDLAIEAVRRALILRGQHGYGPSDSVCPFDIAAKRGIDLRFVALPRLEGMYSVGDPNVILINSLRPSGRRRYTCGHEVGHDLYGHGTRFDGEADEAETRVEEFIANRFARALLMPKLAVASAYSRRGWSPRVTTAEQAFVVAQDMGVGFTTLLDDMSLTLRLLDRSIAQTLSRIPLPKVRASLLAVDVAHDLFPVDRHWGARPLDVEVGDVISTPQGSRFDGRCAENDGSLLRARRAGVGQLEVPGRSAAIEVRVSRRAFAGLARYRHLEDPDDE